MILILDMEDETLEYKIGYLTNAPFLEWYYITVKVVRIICLITIQNVKLQLELTIDIKNKSLFPLTQDIFYIRVNVTQNL